MIQSKQPQPQKGARKRSLVDGFAVMLASTSKKIRTDSHDDGRMVGAASKYRGVSFRPNGSIFAQINTRQKGKVNLGIFRSELEAAQAYDAARRHFHVGSPTSLKLNFPEPDVIEAPLLAFLSDVAITADSFTTSFVQYTNPKSGKPSWTQHMQCYDWKGSFIIQDPEPVNIKHAHTGDKVLAYYSEKSTQFNGKAKQGNYYNGTVVAVLQSKGHRVAYGRRIGVTVPPWARFDVKCACTGQSFFSAIVCHRVHEHLGAEQEGQ